MRRRRRRRGALRREGVHTFLCFWVIPHNIGAGGDRDGGRAGAYGRRGAKAPRGAATAVRGALLRCLGSKTSVSGAGEDESCQERARGVVSCSRRREARRDAGNNSSMAVYTSSSRIGRWRRGSGDRGGTPPGGARQKKFDTSSTS